jgi:HSP20 family protein
VDVLPLKMTRRDAVLTRPEPLRGFVNRHSLCMVVPARHNLMHRLLKGVTPMTMLRRRTPLDFGSIREFMDSFNEPFGQMSEMKPFEAGLLPVDVSEKDGEFLIRASLPGFSRENIDIQVHEGTVTIKAEHNEEHEETGEKFYRRERRFGSVSRSITLPGVTGESAIKAEFVDGVLTLRVPQSEAAKPKKIRID